MSDSVRHRKDANPNDYLLGYTSSPVKAAGELFAANLCAEMVELCAAELAALVPPAGSLLLAPLLTPAPGHAQRQKEKVV
jgi:hypothetical protein